VWITHRLGDGTEYPLVYPFEAVGYLISVLTDAARSARRRRIDRNPDEAVHGSDTDVVPIAEIRVGTAPDGSGAILHLTAADQVQIAAELPAALLAGLIGQLQHAADSIGRAIPPRLLN
jgi:hypothetical protein